MTTSDHTAADAARDAIDRLEDEQDAALAEVERLNGMRAEETKAGDWLCRKLKAANEELGRHRAGRSLEQQGLRNAVAEITGRNDEIERLTAERDEAQATVERVRALADSYPRILAPGYADIATDLRDALKAVEQR